MMGLDRDSSPCFTSSHSRKSRVGLGRLPSLSCVCEVDAAGTAAVRSSCRSKYCLCWSLVRLPAAAALREVFPASLPPAPAAAGLGSIAASAPWLLIPQ